MADPTLNRTSVQIKYASSDGYRADFQVKAGEGAAHSITRGPVPPERALLVGVAELARLCELFGFGDQAQVEFDNARKCVREWRATTKEKSCATCKHNEKVMKSHYPCNDCDTTLDNWEPK